MPPSVLREMQKPWTEVAAELDVLGGLAALAPNIATLSSCSYGLPKGASGRRGEASAVLLPIHDRFAEGFDAPDLKDAKALLAELM